MFAVIEGIVIKQFTGWLPNSWVALTQKQLPTSEDSTPTSMACTYDCWNHNLTFEYYKPLYHPEYELYSQLRFKNGADVYTRNYIIMPKAERHHIRRGSRCYIATTENLLNYKISVLDSIQHVVQCTVWPSIVHETFFNVDVITLGDFNVHNNKWLKFSTHTDNTSKDLYTNSQQANQQRNTLDFLLHRIQIRTHWTWLLH